MTQLPHSSIKALTGIRFWATMLVLLYHLAGPGIGNHHYLINDIIAHGYLGVNLFFVLSGYIIHHVYGLTFSKTISEESYVKFLSFRVARIYPVHVFTMALMFGLYFIGNYIFHKSPEDFDSYELPAIIHNLLMTQAWFGVGSPNVPAWSISAEWFMYLLYPLIAMALFRLNVNYERVMLLACFLAVYYFASLHPLLQILPEFIFGATLYQMNSKLHVTLKLSPYTGLVLTAIILTAFNFNENIEVVYVLLFGMLILALTSERDVMGRWLSHPRCIYLGEISYSLYMIHMFVWSVIKNLCQIMLPSVDIQGVSVVTAGLMVSIIAGAALYALVEVPSRRFLRHLADPKDVMEVS